MTARPAGGLPLKGFAQPIDAYLIEGLSEDAPLQP